MKQILIIDDDIYIGNMLEEVLRKENYQVLRAYSGTEATLLLPSVKPDLILLDLMLPGLTGEELLPRIKDFPVIVLSARVDVDSKVKLLLEGAVDYVTKPFEIKELLARITVALRKNDTSVSNILSFADLHLDTETHMVFSSPKKDSGASSEEIRLTRTESAILKILMLNPDLFSLTFLSLTVRRASFSRTPPSGNSTAVVAILNILCTAAIPAASALLSIKAKCCIPCSP